MPPLTGVGVLKIGIFVNFNKDFAFIFRPLHQTHKADFQTKNFSRARKTRWGVLPDQRNAKILQGEEEISYAVSF